MRRDFWIMYALIAWTFALGFAMSEPKDREIVPSMFSCAFAGALWPISGSIVIASSLAAARKKEDE